MNLEQYAPLAMRTAKVLDAKMGALHAALGIASDSGELITIVKAYTVYGRDLDVVHAREELGDCLWFTVYAASIFNVHLLETWEAPKPILDLSMAALELSVTAGYVSQIVRNFLYYEQNGFGLHDRMNYFLHTLRLTGSFMGVPLMEEAAPANIAKLRLRYPDAYSDAAAIARADKV